MATPHSFGFYKDKNVTIYDYDTEIVGKDKCEAKVSIKICEALIDEAKRLDLIRIANGDLKSTKFLCICIPCYNEESFELLKTIRSLLKNIEFMRKKARLYDDQPGSELDTMFKHTIPVIVPIFDGLNEMRNSMHDWLRLNFPGSLTERERKKENDEIKIPGCLDFLKPEKEKVKPPADPSLGVGNDGVEVRTVLSKWWHYCTEHYSKNDFDLVINETPTISPEEDIIDFFILPIIKRNNHRKHNSHEWFFNSVCMGLGERAQFVFLTDCGTTYNSTCLARLVYELHLRKGLIGVTARQRVETPNHFFHPCQSSTYTWLKGDHSSSTAPCWKCYFNFYCSPAPLQGFEFEATLIMNSAMFNLVEALPVMPGPCQLLDWQKMKKYKVVEEYFKLMFHAEPDGQIPQKSFERLPNYQQMKLPPTKKISGNITAAHENYSSMSNVSDSASSPMISDNRNGEPMVRAAGDIESQRVPAPSTSSTAQLLPLSTYCWYLVMGFPNDAKNIEVLRINMKLAEDRVLSFVCVFSTGDGTKWIPGATFSYTPEITWQALLTQRRRWLNGTFASFLFFVCSERTQIRVEGGMFDSYNKLGKNERLMHILWGMQIYQLVLVLLSPAVFASASYIGIKETARVWPDAFGWVVNKIYEQNAHSFTYADIWIVIYFTFYVLWTVYSHYVKDGKIKESVCVFMAYVSFVFIFPVYFAVWASIIKSGGLNVVDGLVVASIAVPVVIATAQSAKSAVLYLCYLPWFMCLILFFLVYIPSYSFARLWDTTWGNRAGGADVNKSLQEDLKWRNKKILAVLMTVNGMASYALIKLVNLGINYVLAFMLIVFMPMIIQIISSFLFLFVVIPLRNFNKREANEVQSEIVEESNGLFVVRRRQQEVLTKNPSFVELLVSNDE